MESPPRDEEREHRIHMEIVVDAYGPEERALGWYYYLDNTLGFPFRARCIAERATSPLAVGDEVEVVGLPSKDDCEYDMFVLTRRERRPLAVPLAQLESLEGDDQTRQAIEDWRYWVGQGYQF